MRTFDDIRIEIEQLTEQRAELFHQLSGGHDVVLAAEHKRLEERIAELWDEHRAARAQLRWGGRELIIKRARAEGRLDRAAGRAPAGSSSKRAVKCLSVGGSRTIRYPRSSAVRSATAAHTSIT